MLGRLQTKRRSPPSLSFNRRIGGHDIKLRPIAGTGWDLALLDSAVVLPVAPHAIDADGFPISFKQQWLLSEWIGPDPIKLCDRSRHATILYLVNECCEQGVGCCAVRYAVN